MEVERYLNLSVIKPIRLAEEVIADIAKAIFKILRDPSDKTIRYELDQEARQALIGANLKLWQELVLMMAMINLQKRTGEPRNDYVIAVSGKLPPYLNIEEVQSVKGESVNILVQITILPPSDPAQEGPKAEAK